MSLRKDRIKSQISKVRARLILLGDDEGLRELSSLEGSIIEMWSYEDRNTSSIMQMLQ